MQQQPTSSSVKMLFNFLSMVYCALADGNKNCLHTHTRRMHEECMRASIHHGTQNKSSVIKLCSLLIFCEAATSPNPLWMFNLPRLSREGGNCFPPCCFASCRYSPTWKIMYSTFKTNSLNASTEFGRPELWDGSERIALKCKCSSAAQKRTWTINNSQLPSFLKRFFPGAGALHCNDPWQRRDAT